MALQRISLDTAGYDEPAFDSNIARLMQDKPTPPREAKVVRTSNGNLVTPQAR